MIKFQWPWRIEHSVKDTPKKVSTSKVQENPDITKTVPGQIQQPEISQDDIDRVLKSFEEAKRVKEEFIGIFGLFAAILIFSSVEVKIFSTDIQFSKILGISAFFISSLMLFVLTLHNIIHSKDVRAYKSTAFVLALIFFAFSLECFYWSTHYNPAVQHSYIWFLGSKWV